MNKKPLEHGMQLYRKKCRCDVCRKANAKYQSEYQKRKASQKEIEAEGGNSL